MFGVRFWLLSDRERLDDEVWEAMKAGIDHHRRAAAKRA